MQKDFHYYCIAVLAKAAGFSPEDALTIAYASQYVDDATESEPMNVGGTLFEPARTAHYGIECFDWSVQKRIYIPFHFVPPQRITSSGHSFITEPDSSFAREILNTACLNDDGEYTRTLCALGIALHTYADTWAHKGFSGRNDQENDVEGIEYKKSNAWHRPLWDNIRLDMLPKIGHAQAGNYPDMPYEVWRYTNTKRVVVTRNNALEFLKATERIYFFLRKAMRRISHSSQTDVIAWHAISDDIRKLLTFHSDDLETRCSKWRERFRAWYESRKFHYDHLTWRREALKPSNRQMIMWDKNPRRALRSSSFQMTKGFYDSRWVHFHRAALRQRHFVLENIFYT